MARKKDSEKIVLIDVAGVIIPRKYFFSFIPAMYERGICSDDEYKRIGELIRKANEKRGKLSKKEEAEARKIVANVFDKASKDPYGRKILDEWMTSMTENRLEEIRRPIEQLKEQGFKVLVHTTLGKEAGEFIGKMIGADGAVKKFDPEIMKKGKNVTIVDDFDGLRKRAYLKKQGARLPLLNRPKMIKVETQYDILHRPIKSKLSKITGNRRDTRKVLERLVKKGKRRRR
ncbi:hypothetical protein DRN74_02830 [Candidatus Micrarchaeota archaeon]|nr:MAG: hypothetical protein DRN74_02830 [Candidatus Micrarchaeota archaeon]